MSEKWNLKSGKCSQTALSIENDRVTQSEVFCLRGALSSTNGCSGERANRRSLDNQWFSARPLNLALGRFDNTMKIAAKLIPEDLRKFLSTHEYQEITFDRTVNRNMEIDTLEFYAPSRIKLSSFELYTHEYYLNHDEPGDDPNLLYNIEGISLIQDCNSYDPDGVLIYFPAFQEYGCGDGHGVIMMYPRIGWAKIEARLDEYVNASWYPDEVEHYLLRPWADKRCTRIKPKPSPFG